MSQNNSQIEWYQVTDALPAPDKEVMVTDGISVSTSMLSSIVIHPNGKGWDAIWRHGALVTQWAFMPKVSESTPTQQFEISIW